MLVIFLASRIVLPSHDLSIRMAILSKLVTFADERDEIKGIHYQGFNYKQKFGQNNTV